MMSQARDSPLPMLMAHWKGHSPNHNLSHTQQQKVCAGNSCAKATRDFSAPWPRSASLQPGLHLLLRTVPAVACFLGHQQGKWVAPYTDREGLPSGCGQRSTNGQCKVLTFWGAVPWLMQSLLEAQCLMQHQISHRPWKGKVHSQMTICHISDSREIQNGNPL